MWGGGASILAQVASRGLLDEMAFEWTLKENLLLPTSSSLAFWDLGPGSVCLWVDLYPEALKGLMGSEQTSQDSGHTGTVGCSAV